MKPVLLIVIISKLRYLLVPLLLLSLTACSGFLFFRGKNWVRTPEQLGIEYRDVELMAEDGVKLSAWWLQPRGEVKGTILFLHGNAENISTHLGSVYWMPELGYQVLLLDYRGYGHSEGTPSLPAVFNDINAAFDWMLVQPEVQDKPVYLLGQSLGASMGGYVVATTPKYQRQLDAVVLDAGFASYSEIAREVASRHWLTWAFQYPAGWSMPGAYDLVDHVDSISPTPLLIIHGTEDAVVPFSQGERIFEAAKKPKSFLRYDGPHIGTFKDLGNRDLMMQFLEQAPARKKAAETKLEERADQPDS
jgi:fermentation-respiration switch protein FrsA (DUF1100 family)